jgi:hypothetical protein
MMVRSTIDGGRIRNAVLAVTLAGALAACGTTPSVPEASSNPSTPTSAPSSAPTAASASPSGGTSASPGGGSADQPSRDPSADPQSAQLELPRGGRTVFPRYRLVGYAGLTGASTLGRLGTGPLDQRIDELERRARPYAAGREVLPVLEVITTIVQASPGRDGKYRVRLSDARIRTYLRAARRHDALLLLNIQPGRARFIDEVRAYRKWLAKPDVGVALDPEWAMGPGEVPGRVFGHTTGKELDGVARYLSQIVREHDLPEKVMVYHQLAVRIVRQESQLRDHPGVAVVKSVDGIGSRAAKTNTYRVVIRPTPKFVAPGFKLFFTEDREFGPLMTPRQVLGLRPRPAYVMFE